MTPWYHLNTMINKQYFTLIRTLGSPVAGRCRCWHSGRGWCWVLWGTREASAWTIYESSLQEQDWGFCENLQNNLQWTFYKSLHQSHHQKTVGVGWRRGGRVDEIVWFEEHCCWSWDSALILPPRPGSEVWPRIICWTLFFYQILEGDVEALAWRKVNLTNPVQQEYFLD